ncbi:MAG: hypothetical protein N4A65_13850 [Cohaesibacter sp.]|jgi:hypothetical protein|nr:hypothetical protein [Cohaesibacter sp.]
MSCCGNGTKVKTDPLAFRNHYPLPVRVMIGVFGAVLLSLPYYLLIAPGWNHFSWVLIPYGIIGIAAGLGGLSFFLSALAGEARETRIDLASQCLTQTSRGLTFKRKIERTPFRDIAFFEMQRPSWATDEKVLTLTPMLANGDSLAEFGAFPSEEEAQKIMALMGHMPGGVENVAQHWTTAEIEALKQSLAAQSSPQGACSMGARGAQAHGSGCGCQSSRPQAEDEGRGSYKGQTQPDKGIHLVH